MEETDLKKNKKIKKPLHLKQEFMN